MERRAWEESNNAHLALRRVSKSMRSSWPLQQASSSAVLPPRSTALRSAFAESSSRATPACPLAAASMCHAAVAVGLLAVEALLQHLQGEDDKLWVLEIRRVFESPCRLP